MTSAETSTWSAQLKRGTLGGQCSFPRGEREGDFVYFSVAGEDGVLQHAGGSFRIALQAPYLVGLGRDGRSVLVGELADTGFVIREVRPGARVGFSFMSAVIPPPWTMKFSITRWNTVPS